MTPLLAGYLFAVSVLFMGILTPIAIALGRRWSVVDLPGPRKVHRDPTPLTGGWAIFATLSVILWGHILGALVLRGYLPRIHVDKDIEFYISMAPRLIAKIGPVYAGAVAIFIIGLVDDLKGMSVRSRLVVQTLVAIVLSALGFHPSLSFLPHWVAALAGVVWIVGITNAFNFLDGLDGLSAGVALVGATALLTIMGIGSQPDVVFLLAMVSGALLGFLRYNYNPAKIFLGSSGSLLLGYLMSMSTLLVTYMKGDAENTVMPLLTPVFILAIPLYDTISVVLIRLIQHRSIAIGDQSHFHHRLLKLGFSHRQTVGFIVLIAFSVALSAVRLVTATLFQGALIILQIACLMLIIVVAERVALKVRTQAADRARSPDNSESDVQQPDKVSSSHDPQS